MGDPVQVLQRFFVGKDDGAQSLPIQLTALYRPGEPGFDGPGQGGVFPEQPVVDGVTVQNQTARPGNGLQQGGFSGAAAAGDSDNHSSSSALTMWKAAAFFSRFCTA